jgi:cytochrome c6
MAIRIKEATSMLGAVTLVVLLGVNAIASGADEGGDQLYKTKCAACHGPDGRGEVPMGKKLGARDLNSAEVQKQSDAQLTEVITKGKNKMPAYNGKLSKEQIAQLVAYVREIGKKH